ncbi:MAG TPA: hypothetical protein DCQ06_04240 [Myxococcales bacterium]|nr:hypothetical protein [Myxococcales bacterium]
MVLLGVSILALLAGPLLAAWMRPQSRVARAIDGYVLVTMIGLVLSHLLPESMRTTGLWGGFAALCGLALPIVVHRRLERITDGHDHHNHHNHHYNNNYNGRFRRHS